MDKIECKGSSYPIFQARGFASQFAFPFARHYCKGLGVDVGCMLKEWALPGAIPVDQSFDERWHAMDLPIQDIDYIFSSHCAEHLITPYNVFDYWNTVLKSGGCLFLYLPHFSQKYWRPWNKTNSPHYHVFTPEIIQAYFEDQPEMWTDITVSNVDLNNSFIAIAHKK